MAKTKSGRIYKQIKSQSFTRREYMGGVPGSRLVQFDAGDTKGDFPVVAHLVANERVAIMHNTLETARIVANRVMSKSCGAQGYHMRVRPYPHEVLRENKQASGAGADRVSQGMRRSFGKNIATAARVDVGQAILTFRVRAEQYPAVKEAARKANMKLPTPTHLVIEKGADLVREIESRGIKIKITPSKAPKEPKPEGEAAEAAAGEKKAEEPKAGDKKGDAKPGGKDAKPAAGKDAKPAAGKDAKPAKK